MNKFLLCFFLLALKFQLSAQAPVIAFQTMYGTDNQSDFSEVLELYNHDIVCAGRDTTTAMITCLDSVGHIKWNRHVDVNGQFAFFSKIIQLKDSGIVALINANYSYLVKFDLLGNLIWSYELAGTGANSLGDIIPLPDGGFASCGGGCSTRYGVMRFDANCNIIFKETIDPSPYTGGYFSKMDFSTKNDHIYLLGYHSLLGQTNPKLVITDTSGTVINEVDFYLPNNTNASITESILVIDSAVYILLSNVDTTAYNYKPIIIKTDLNGTFQWCKKYQFTRNVFTNGLVSDGLGHLVICGVYDTLGAQQFAFQIDTAGNLLQVQIAGNMQFNSAGLDAINCGATATNGYLFAGTLQAPSLTRTSFSLLGFCSSVSAQPVISVLNPPRTVMSTQVANNTMVRNTNTPSVTAFTWSPIESCVSTSTDLERNEKSAWIYPNPTAGSSVEIMNEEGNEGVVRISIYSVTGQLLREQSIGNNNSIDIEGLEGLVIIRIQYESGMISNERLLIIH